MNVLICLLGLSPGVATGAYYALVRDRGIQIDRLVTLTTFHHQAGDCERIIERELQDWQEEQGVVVQYDGLVILDKPEANEISHTYGQTLGEQLIDNCRVRIPYEELNDEPSVKVFRETLLTLVRRVYRKDNIYLCVAGGRKSMSAIAAIAAHLYGHSVKGLYHLYVQKDIEDDGPIEKFEYLSSENKRRVLRPLPDEVRLVELPFFQITVQGGQPQLALRGEVQDYILDYLADNPDLVTVLEPDTKGNILGYVFEAQVCDYVRRLGYTAVQSKTWVGFDGDIDIYAERNQEILICECEMRENPKQTIAPKKVRQIIDRLDFLRQRESERHITAWVASTATSLEDEVNQWPKIESFAGTVQVVHFPLRPDVVQQIEKQNWAALLRKSWFEDSKVQLLHRP